MPSGTFSVNSSTDMNTGTQSHTSYQVGSDGEDTTLPLPDSSASRSKVRYVRSAGIPDLIIGLAQDTEDGHRPKNIFDSPDNRSHELEMEAWLNDRQTRIGDPSTYQMLLAHHANSDDSLLGYGLQAKRSIDKSMLERMRSICGNIDSPVFPLGGGLYAVLVALRNEELDVLARKIVNLLTLPFWLGAERPFTPTVRMGISRRAGDLDLLMRSAISTLRQCQGDAPGLIAYAEESLLTTTGRHIQRGQLALQFLVDGNFEVHFQPIFDVAKSRIRGFEALCRPPRNPAPGELAISAAEFVAACENAGAAVDLTAQVLLKALEFIENAPNTRFRISVNVPASVFASPIFLDLLAEISRTNPTAAQHISLELTESGAVTQPTLMAETFAQIELWGYEIWLDDFGTGFSSLSHLVNLPVTGIKIDQSFVKALGTEGNVPTLVDGLISLAAGLKLACIAEGVETNEQLAYLQQRNCFLIQGYLLGVALPAAAAILLLAPSFPAQIITDHTAVSDIRTRRRAQAANHLRTSLNRMSKGIPMSSIESHSTGTPSQFQIT